jgi:hypothetical protein
VHPLPQTKRSEAQDCHHGISEGKGAGPEDGHDDGGKVDGGWKGGGGGKGDAGVDEREADRARNTVKVVSAGKDYGGELDNSKVMRLKLP